VEKRKRGRETERGGERQRETERGRESEGREVSLRFTVFQELFISIL